MFFFKLEKQDWGRPNDIFMKTEDEKQVWCVKKNAYKKTVKIYSKVVEILHSFLYFYPLKRHLMFSAGAVTLVQIVVKRWTTSEGGKDQQPCQKTACYWMETVPIGIHGVWRSVLEQTATKSYLDCQQAMTDWLW